MLAALTWSAADAIGIGVLAILLAAVIRRVLYWTDQFRDYGERLSRLEQRVDDALKK